VRVRRRPRSIKTPTGREAQMLEPLPADEGSVPQIPPSSGFVFDMNMRQLFVGDYVALPCFNSVVDRGMVIAITGSIVEFMIVAPDTGIPETVLLDMRRPDPQTGYFGRFAYVGVVVCARRGEPAAKDFAKQLLAACEEVKQSNPRFNPYLAAQANTRVEFLKEFLQHS
jgi:hypothetical protein